MWFLHLLIGLAFAVVGYLIMPKPKPPKPPAVKDMENPTAEAGRPIPVLFGTMTIKGSNILWFGEKQSIEHKKSGGGKGGK